LKRLKIGVNPWLLGVEDISNNDPDERVAKVHANMGGEILDTRVNLLPLSINLWKQVNRAVILHLTLISLAGEEKKKTGNTEHTHKGVGVTNKLEFRDC